jgi:hypothetical protein
MLSTGDDAEFFRQADCQSSRHPDPQSSAVVTRCPARPSAARHRGAVKTRSPRARAPENVTVVETIDLAPSRDARPVIATRTPDPRDADSTAAPELTQTRPARTFAARRKYCGTGSALRGETVVTVTVQNGGHHGDQNRQLPRRRAVFLPREELYHQAASSPRRAWMWSPSPAHFQRIGILEAVATR